MSYRPPRKTAGVDPASWAYGARTVGGQPLDHRLQPYVLEPLYESALAMEAGSEGCTVGFLKGRQTGLTTAGMSLLLWHGDQHGGMSLHAVPTQKNAERFNSTILVPTLDDTVFQNIAPGVIWNQDVKSFKGVGPDGHSFSYVLGHTLGGNQTAEGDGFRGLTAQVVLFDERGTMPEAACSVIESCLDTALTPVVWNIGSAGFRGDALDRFFRNGTRGEWVIPCTNCAKHTILVEYGDEVDEIGACLAQSASLGWFYACEHCGREIDPGLGHWEHQEGPHKTYHVSSLNSCFFVARKLKARLDNPNTTEESLMREVGGLPFGGEGLTVEPADIQLFREVPKAATFAVMSVDWGSRTSWLKMKSADRVYVTDIGTVDGKHDAHVTQLLKESRSFSPDYIACDQGFEGGRNEKMDDATGAAWGIISNLAPRPGNVLEQVQRDRRNHTYRIVRPWVWERLVEAIRKGDQPGGVVFAPGLEALRADILSVTPEKAGRGTREWVTYDMTAQHFAACLLYAFAIVLRERGRKSHSSVGKGNPMNR